MTAILALSGAGDLPNGGWLVAAFAIVIVVTVGTIAIVIVDRRGLDFDVQAKPFAVHLQKRSTPDQTRELRLQAAMARLGDLEQAMVATAAGPVDEREARLGRWFTYLCENLAEVLAAGGHTRYRVSIWTDDPADVDNLRLLALQGFDRNDPRMEHLERATTVAGWAIEHRREHYVADCAHDPIYRPRRSTPAYKSMVAVPLGGEDPWAVITVDASIVDGITDDQVALIRRFGVLASTAASLADAADTLDPVRSS